MAINEIPKTRNIYGSVRNIVAVREGAHFMPEEGRVIEIGFTNGNSTIVVVVTPYAAADLVNALLLAIPRKDS